MIVNSAPHAASNCSPSRGNLFTLPWNPCSRSCGNAVHHRVEYAPEGRVTLAFAVSDAGMGVPRSQLESLFTPFTQADASVTRKHGGSGLGLSICRRLVDAMEGKITVKSCEGQGRHSDLKFFSIVRMRGLIRARCCRQFMRLSSMTIRSICGSL